MAELELEAEEVEQVGEETPLVWFVQLFITGLVLDELDDEWVEEVEPFDGEAGGNI